MIPPSIVIAGIGNLLLSDDGVGIHAIRRLRNDPRLKSVARVIDAGTVGAGLIAEVCGCERLLILDAVDADMPPGTAIRMDLSLSWTQSIYARNAHQAGIAGLLDDLRLMGCEPRETVLLGIQPGTLAFGTELSAEVAAGLPALLRQAVWQVERWRAGTTKEISQTEQVRERI